MLCSFSFLGKATVCKQYKQIRNKDKKLSFQARRKYCWTSDISLLPSEGRNQTMTQELSNTERQRKNCRRKRGAN